ncbi:MAG: aminodeoxychorismate/anthranilate synthase component II [Candidatus Sumerlaeaceae bacterium]|nr:aminodeoxychorismate/anthranilate synthase component II [Candidatus Sumerlaeaceae bacterium]
MLLVIDNYDSFTFNLVQYLGELGAEMEVVRNDKIELPRILEMAPSHIVISPGPCTPNEAGISLDIVKVFGETVPILGVCLGHQCIGQSFGGSVVRADKVMHGKTSEIFHSGDPLFDGMSNPFIATRYHSLIVKRDTIPAALEVIAWTGDDIVMGLKHRTQPVWGVQFHPESILTTEGKTLLGNFLKQKAPAKV